MMWLLLIVVDVLADSTRIFIDNYISDYYYKGKEAVAQKLFYGYAYLIIALIAAFAFGFNLETIVFSSAILVFLAGVISSLGGIPYYRALEIENSTSLGIFLQLSPVLYLIAGWFLLGESFSPIQLVAFLIIISAPILIVTTARKKSRHLEIKAVLCTLVYVLAYVSSSLIFVKETMNGLSIVNAIILILLGKGVGNISIIYCRPKWRKRYYYVMNQSKRKVVRPMLVNSILGVVADFTYRTALATAPAVALASAISDSSEPIVIFFMGIILTLIWPKFGREKLNKKTVLVHLIATILVVIGVAILQIQT